MSLGWGLRGSIGGSTLGAMIPGAMVSLAIAMLLGRGTDAALIAALGAVGVGFGGQETYGQTVGLSLKPETYWWAITGFAVKGSVWGLLGGAFLGIALVRERLSTRRILVALALMVAGTWLGWKVVNEPKLVYFSNLYDRPREELWAGLWLGGLLFLAAIRSAIPTWFALWGALGGGLGFGLGAAAQVWGRGHFPNPALDWWKVMELTFGALLGLAYGWSAWSRREQLVRQEEPAGDDDDGPASWMMALGLAAVGIAIMIPAGQLLPVRFGHTIAGAVLSALLLGSSELCRQTAITVTYCAFTWDFIKGQKVFPPAAMWVLLVATTVLVAMVVARRRGPRFLFLLLTWTAVGNSFRYLLPPAKLGPQLPMLGAFVVLAVVITVGVGSLRNRSLTVAAR
jgi:hypothetical protein